MVFKKGQAAMEYLMTYGWAILIVLAIMGILVYLVRPQQIETCTIATPFQCEPNQYTINANQNLTINLRNLGSVAVIINGAACPSSGSIVSMSPIQLTPGSTRSISINCSASPNIVTNPKIGSDVFQETILLRYSVGNVNKSIPLEIVVRYS